MKKILITMVLLFTATTYSQYVVIDTLNNVVTLTAQQQRDIDNILNGAVFGQDITTLRNQLEALDIEFNAYKLTTDGRLDKLEDGGTVVYPTAPTELVATGVSTSQIDLTWKGGFRDYSAVIIWRSTTGSNYSELLRQVGSDSTYSDTGLNEGTPYWYYVSFYDSTYQLASNYSNSDSGLTLVTPPSGGGATYDYYVAANADGTGDGSEANPWTIYQAVVGATAGDTVFMQKGQYNIASGTITIRNSGTYNNPIVFYGEHDEGYSKKPPSASEMAMFYCTTGTNGAINLNGDYITFDHIATYQNIGKQTYNITGDYVTLDSCVVYTPDAIGSEHTIVVKPSAQHFTMQYCYIYQSGRTAVWAEASSTEASDYTTFNACEFDGQSHHYSIQIMPLTNVVSPPNNKGSVIKNCYFHDVPYSSAIYLRNFESMQIYNNVFVKAGGLYGSPINIQTHEYPPYDTVDCKNSIVAFNTYIAEDYASYQEYVHHIGNINGLKMFNNLAVFSSVNYMYRTGCAYNTIAAGHRWESDYNCFYAIDDPSWTGTKRSVWYNSTDCATTTYTWAQTKSILGFDNHSIVGILPLFVNSAGRDYRPASGSCVIGGGIPITTGAGFIIDILTDKNGVTRDATHPTIGAYEYVP